MELKDTEISFARHKNTQTWKRFKTQAAVVTGEAHMYCGKVQEKKKPGSHNFFYVKNQWNFGNLYDIRRDFLCGTKSS